jgi:cytochrome c-type biogenesis protein CcmH/NrfF
MKRHALDPVSLVFGLLFAGLGGVFLLASIDVATTGLRWVWPLPLLALGALLIALGVRRTSESTQDDERIAG